MVSPGVPCTWYVVLSTTTLLIKKSNIVGRCQNVNLVLRVPIDAMRGHLFENKGPSVMAHSVRGHLKGILCSRKKTKPHRNEMANESLTASSLQATRHLCTEVAGKRNAPHRIEIHWTQRSWDIWVADLDFTSVCQVRCFPNVVTQPFENRHGKEDHVSKVRRSPNQGTPKIQTIRKSWNPRNTMSLKLWKSERRVNARLHKPAKNPTQGTPENRPIRKS